MGKHGITLNCIKPGRITSEQMLRMHPTEEQRREFTREVPVQRFGEPDELADLAVFLASPRARLYRRDGDTSRWRPEPFRILIGRARG